MLAVCYLISKLDSLRLADNKIALNAGWDTEILKLELAELSLPEIDIDLGLTGFSPGEIDVVLSEKVDPDEEVIPAVPTEPRARLGDIWQLGEHRVGCGDGRDLAFLQAVVGDRWRGVGCVHGSGGKELKRPA